MNRTELPLPPRQTQSPLLAMVAGEASGDLLGSLLVRSLAPQLPDFRIAGIGGPLMQQYGMQPWWPSERLSVFGYADALRRLPELLWIRRQLKQRLLQQPTRLFVGIDAPDFNLGLEQSLRAHGIPTVHFVCPSIWAWRPERIERIRRSANHVLCLFPFEPEILNQRGISASYVGHPLASSIPMQPPTQAARTELRLPTEGPVVALLPGSRRSEIKLLAPVMRDAALLLFNQEPQLRFILPAAPGMHSVLSKIMAPLLDTGTLLITSGGSHTALAACDAAMVASGTATLEAALFKKPMVITYRLSAFNWQRMKNQSLLPWVVLPNILCRDFVVPELIQHAATPAALAHHTMRCLQDTQIAQQVLERFTVLHETLRQNTPALISQALEPYLR